MICYLLLFLINTSIFASMEKSYSDASDFMADKSPTTDIVTNGNLSQVPGFAGNNPPEASMYGKPDILTEQSNQALNNDTAQNFIQTANTRQRFNIDPQTDPLFKIPPVDPGLVITDEPQETNEGMLEKTCLEGGDDILHQCFENRIVHVNVPIKTVTLTVNHLEFTPQYQLEHYSSKQKSGWNSSSISGTRYKLSGYTLSLPKSIDKFKDQFCKGFTGNIDCNRIVGFRINSGSISETQDFFTIKTSTNALNITLQHQTYENEAIDQWTGCDQFESMVEQDLCQYGERILTEGPATRLINGYPIFREDWQYKQTYNCKMIKDECSALRAKGCVQVGSRCQEQLHNKCWIYEQKYRCPNGKLSLSHIKTPALGGFCLTGNCHDTSYAANGEMLDAIAKLNVLKEVQFDLKNQNSQGDFKIFSGQSYKCSRNCLNFKDCCGGGKGWGVKFKFADCKAEEKQLATMRQKNLCHQVGQTYCSKKVAGKCVTKKTSFCCFGSKLAKVLQVEGRHQLNLSWGDAKCPNCRALSIEELSRMDLSRMNFSELFEDIMKKYKAPDLNHLQEATRQQVNDNIKRMADNLKPAAHGVVNEKDRL